MLVTLNKSNFIIVTFNTKYDGNLTRISIKLMQENSNDYNFCIKAALDNAKERINILDKYDKKCVLEEYKEWINDGLGKHSVLLLREDPII